MLSVTRKNEAAYYSFRYSQGINSPNRKDESQNWLKSKISFQRVTSSATYRRDYC